MGKIYIYVRVSTAKQDFDRQMIEIKQYFISNNIDFKTVSEIVSEHVSGGKSYTDRKFVELLDKCEQGDTIYAASTDRLGRNFSDMIKLMDDAKKRGVKIVACKQNLSLSDDSMVTKIILSIITLMDEDEKNRIQSRAKSTAEFHRQMLKEQGGWMSKSGRWVTSLGNEKGVKTDNATRASVEARRNSRDTWKNQSVAYQFVKMKVLAGWSSKDILEEFDRMAQIDPRTYCTRTGDKMSEGVLSRWRKEIKKDSEQEALLLTDAD